MYSLLDIKVVQSTWFDRRGGGNQVIGGEVMSIAVSTPPDDKKSSFSVDCDNVSSTS